MIYGSDDELHGEALIDFLADRDCDMRLSHLDFPLIEEPDLTGLLRPDGTVGGRRLG